MDATIARRKQRWVNFLNNGPGPHHLFVIHLMSEMKPRPWPWPGNVPERIDWAWDFYQGQLKRLEWLDDDALPRLDPFTGTEIFAEAFGCPVHYPPDNMPFALPLIHSAAEVSKVRVPDLDTPALARVFHIADELVRRAGKGALMRLVDIQSPMDIAALIWDKNDFYLALVESPEAVRELASKVHALLVKFLDEWFNRYGRDFIAHYPEYYMPRGLTLSEDEVGVVNAEMFRELFLPELTELSRRYGALGIHCCADSLHQWENFKSIPNLKLLNLVRPAEQARQAHEFFKDHVAQMHSWGGDGPAWTWPQQHPPGVRVVMEIGVRDRNEAMETVARLRPSCGQ